MQGEQEREVVRVLLHCALAERSWNPYYGHLALKLARASKSHRLTLQFALWDQFKVRGTALHRPQGFGPNSA